MRRVQFKFKNESDFTRAVDILADLQLPITDSRPNPAGNSRPSAAPTMPSSSTYKSNSTRISLPPPTSVIQPPQGSSSQGFSEQSCKSMNDTFKMPIRPDTASSESYRASSRSSVFTRPHSASSVYSAPPLSSHTTQFEPTHELIKRSSSSNLYLAQAEREVCY